MAPRTVLVTGMSGLIGGALRRHLDGKYELSALNRRPIPGVKCHQADIADLDAIAPAFDGVDTVVHLAARTGSSDSFDEILRANVIGTYNVFEAARTDSPRSASASAASRPKTGRRRRATTRSGAASATSPG